MDFELNALLQGEAMQTWIRIMQWAWVAAIFWITALLFRGGFNDFHDILRSPYATRAERWRTRLQIPVRAAGLVLAGVFGATAFAIPFWFQGAVLITAWRQLTSS